MVQYLLDYAKSCVQRVHLRVVVTNTVARRFFARLGFKIYGLTSYPDLDGRIRLMLAISVSKQSKIISSREKLISWLR